MMALSHNLVVFAPIIIKFGTVRELDVFYTTAAKTLWRRCYYVIMTSQHVTPKPGLDGFSGNLVSVGVLRC